MVAVRKPTSRSSAGSYQGGVRHAVTRGSMHYRLDNSKLVRYHSEIVMCILFWPSAYAKNDALCCPRSVGNSAHS